MLPVCIKCNRPTQPFQQNNKLKIMSLANLAWTNLVPPKNTWNYESIFLSERRNRKLRFLLFVFGGFSCRTAGLHDFLRSFFITLRVLADVNDYWRLVLGPFVKLVRFACRKWNGGCQIKIHNKYGSTNYRRNWLKNSTTTIEARVPWMNAFDIRSHVMDDPNRGLSWTLNKS